MNRSPNGGAAALLGALLLALFAGCEDGGGAQNSSATHFLDVCVSICPGGLDCICGICTLSCTIEGDCARIGSARATCVATVDAHPQCEASSAPARVCDTLCIADDNCTSLSQASRCVAGHCRSLHAAKDAGTTRADGSADAAPVGNGGTQSGGTDASDGAATLPDAMGAATDAKTGAGGAGTDAMVRGIGGRATDTDASVGRHSPLDASNGASDTGPASGGEAGPAADAEPALGAIGHSCVNAGECLSRCCVVQPNQKAYCADAAQCGPPCMAAGTRPCALGIKCCPGTQCVSDAINQICLPNCTKNEDCATGCCADLVGFGQPHVCADPAYCP